VTEFNYEKFFPSAMLKNVDTESEEFKLIIKVKNWNEKTAFEQHKENQALFKLMMPLFRTLNEDESEAFLHMVKNKSRTMNAKQNISNQLMDNACFDVQKKKLAKVSEEANLLLKNRFKLENDVMQYAKSEKMPLSEMKVKDMLRNQAVVRRKIVDEIGTYRQF